MTARGPVDVFFDYVCPFAYVTAGRAPLVERELGLAVRWRPWEIYPAAPRPGPPRPDASIGERVQALADEIDLPIRAPAFRPSTHLALLGQAFADGRGAGPAYRAAVFDAHWLKRRHIGDVDVLCEIAASVGLERDAFRLALLRADGWSELWRADRDAERLGVALVPSWILGGEVYVAASTFAEHRAALARFLETAR